MEKSQQSGLRQGFFADGQEEALLRKSGDASSRDSLDYEPDFDELDSLNEDSDWQVAHGRSQRHRRPGSLLDAQAFAKEQALARSTLAKATSKAWRWRKWLLIASILIFGIIAIAAGGGLWVYKTAPKDGLSPPWYPTPPGGTLSSWQKSFSKAHKMVERMSLAEKVNVTTGVGWSMGLCVGNTGPAIKAGFPALCLQDGPLGLRFADRISAFPAGVTTGATWNRSLIYERGRALGREARLKGVNVLLGPSMGPLGRMPAGGRNWEGFGPDPVLQGIAAAETIKGIQEEGVMATAKHYILNEQEHFRQSYEWGLPNAMSSNIDDRTLHELYLWPFADSVRAGVASVMCSYQMVNNSYACGNSKILNGILKDELGFQGFVQSDWLAQRSGVASALAGLLNDMVTRIVAAWYQLGQDDASSWPPPPPEGDGGPNFSSWTDKEIGELHPGSDDRSTGVVNKFVNAEGEGKSSHRHLAKRIAVEGTVLVKNDGDMLPLSRDGWADDAENDRELKLRVAVFGEDAGEGKGKNACPDRGCNQGTLGSGWGSGAVDFGELITPLAALKAAFNSEKVYLTSFPTNHPPLHAAPAIIKDQDICLVFINSDGGEGYIASGGIRGDRNDLFPQKGGDRLVKSVANDCGDGEGQTVVVVHAVGPTVLEEWVDLKGVKAVILANLPGEESGNALVDILFGNVNPSGKLPYTVGKSLEHYGEGGQIMYYPNAVVPQQDFKEGLYIDYRHFDKVSPPLAGARDYIAKSTKHDVEPRYEFGFGLSYTSFNLSNISCKAVKERTRFPSPRPESLDPPTYSKELPPISEAIFPATFRQLKNYVYPYIKSAKDVQSGDYPYPTGYDVKQPLSPAGGGEGGNPSLWDIHAEVKVTLSNTGSRAGSEVVQLYVSFPDNVTASPQSKDVMDFPVKVLRQFEKVQLDAGKSRELVLKLTRKDLSYWSVVHQNWVMPTQGKFKIRVGNSSRNLPLEVEF
ncbi:MAG: hypothetical protein M1837_000359 [Sclerophora amabilis]|nr:MAG: hypothetical protein M1837_000359 [Sclerophora amabilis]